MIHDISKYLNVKKLKSTDEMENIIDNAREKLYMYDKMNFVDLF